jgi:hypothetical protein
MSSASASSLFAMSATELPANSNAPPGTLLPSTEGSIAGTNLHKDQAFIKITSFRRISLSLPRLLTKSVRSTLTTRLAPRWQKHHSSQRLGGWMDLRLEGTVLDLTGRPQDPLDPLSPLDPLHPPPLDLVDLVDLVDLKGRPLDPKHYLQI